MKRTTLVIILLALLAVLVVSCLALTGCVETNDSEVLSYELLEDKTYCVVGVGTNYSPTLDNDIIIPPKYRGRPVTAIGEYAFQETIYHQISINSITIPASVKYIGKYAFYSSGILSITFEEGSKLESIGSYAFENCTSLKSITIPSIVTCIEEGAFSGCSNLTSITIPDSVTYIGSDAFFGCSSLTSITIPRGIQAIMPEVFQGCSKLKSVTIPNGVTMIRDKAFLGCTDLANITFGSESCLTSIGDSAFESCSSLASITIPNSVTSIGDSAFESCSSLTSITIPNSVTSIGGAAFHGCTSLKNITLPFVGHAIKCDDYLHEGLACPHFGYIFGDSILVSLIYSFHSLRVPESLKTVVITDGTSVPNYAFAGCEYITSITIPDSVTSIGGCAFYGCSNLTSITIPDSVTTIDGLAFHGCYSFKTVYYKGSEHDWANISISGGYETDTFGYPTGNSTLLTATRYYYSETQPTTEGNYWHYVDGVPTKW